MEIIAQAERKLYALALITAPLLIAISTFFWQDGLYIGGMIQVYAFIFWIPAFIGLLSLLRPTYPRLSVWGMLLTSAVSVAGSNFGMERIYLDRFVEAGADATQMANLATSMTVAQYAVLNLPGLLFPLTLIAIGLLLWRTQAIPAWSAMLLCLGAVAFPISRIPNIQLIAHVSDLLMLVAAVSIGWQFLQGEVNVQPAPSAAGFGDD